jgi:hypothetical protein
MVHLVSARWLAAVHETVSTGPTPWRWCLGGRSWGQAAATTRAPGSRPTHHDVRRHLAGADHAGSREGQALQAWCGARRCGDRSSRCEWPTQSANESWVLYRSPGAFLGIATDLPFYLPPVAQGVALMPQRRQDYPNNRPPTRATAISGVGHERTQALQKLVARGSLKASFGEIVLSGGVRSIFCGK